jgi:hypothetical protein
VGVPSSSRSSLPLLLTTLSLAVLHTDSPTNHLELVLTLEKDWGVCHTATIQGLCSPKEIGRLCSPKEVCCVVPVENDSTKRYSQQWPGHWWMFGQRRLFVCC